MPRATAGEVPVWGSKARVPGWGAKLIGRPRFPAVSIRLRRLQVSRVSIRRGSRLIAKSCPVHTQRHPLRVRRGEGNTWSRQWLQARDCGQWSGAWPSWEQGSACPAQGPPAQEGLSEQVGASPARGALSWVRLSLQLLPPRGSAGVRLPSRVGLCAVSSAPLGPLGNWAAGEGQHASWARAGRGFRGR